MVRRHGVAPVTDASTLRDRLRTVEDPMTGEDIISMDLVNEITIEDGTAHVSLAFNTPYAPAEIEIGERIRDLIAEEGFEPSLSADVGAEHGFDEDVLPGVRNVIAVASGKGGVGKTTVAANLAAGLADLGASVGLLDADVHGPNAPPVLGIDPEEEPGVEPTSERLVPPEGAGVKVMSMGFLLHDPDDPAIMRGPMVNKVMTHFLENVTWGGLDYLVVDLPPGTGDASLDLLQTLPVTGTVIVTTPERLSLSDARKGLRLFEKHDTPIIGIVENMSGFQCPTCGDEHQLYSGSGAAEISEEYDVEHLGQIPTHPDFGPDGTEGPVVQSSDNPIQGTVAGVVEQALERIGTINRQRVARPEAPPGTQ